MVRTCEKPLLHEPKRGAEGTHGAPGRSTWHKESQINLRTRRYRRARPTAHGAPSATFSHPDYHCRPRNLTVSTATALYYKVAAGSGLGVTNTPHYRRSGISPCPEGWRSIVAFSIAQRTLGDNYGLSPSSSSSTMTSSPKPSNWRSTAPWLKGSG